MTKDQTPSREKVIAWAQEAEISDTTIEFYKVELERFAALVAAAERAEMAKHCAEITRAAVTKAVDGAIALEREACAKLAANTVCDTHIPTGVKIYGTRVAAAIRARKENT